MDCWGVKIRGPAKTFTPQSPIRGIDVDHFLALSMKCSRRQQDHWLSYIYVVIWFLGSSCTSVILDIYMMVFL